MATLRRMKTLLTDTNYNERIEHAKSTAKDAGWGHWFQSFPVHAELETALNGLSKTMPNAKFHPAEFTRRTENDKQMYIITEFSVYMDEYPFDFGRFGFRDYSVSRDEAAKPPTFGIYSRKIHNTKFNDGRDQFHMVMTASVDKAIKLASKYLVPYTHRELAQAYYKYIAREMDEARRAATREMHTTTSAIQSMNADTLAMEIINLMAQHADFKTEAFKDVALKIKDVVNRLEEERSRTVSALFTRFRVVGDDVYVDVQEAHDVRTNDTKPALLNQPTTYLQSELPEDLLGSISVLSILEDGQYVPRVGQKIDERTFWIERG